MIEFNNVFFRNLEDKEDDYKLLYKWCSQKFIYEWFEQRKLSYEEIKNKYKNKLKNKEQDLFIITYNNINIGLVQIYKYNNDISLKELENYKNIYEYDIFIGEEDYLLKGIGSNVVKLINKMIYEDYNADAIILRPFKRNIRAIKCYEKCKFKNIYEYVGKDTLGNNEKIIVYLNKKGV